MKVRGLFEVCGEREENAIFPLSFPHRTCPFPFFFLPFFLFLSHFSPPPPTTTALGDRRRSEEVEEVRPVLEEQRRAREVFLCPMAGRGGFAHWRPELEVESALVWCVFFPSNSFLNSCLNALNTCDLAMP